MRGVGVVQRHAHGEHLRRRCARLSGDLLQPKDGARPFRELEAASDGVLAHATVGRFLRQEGGRPTRQFVRAFAIACGAKGMVLREWEHAWNRAEEQRLGAPAVISRRRASEIVLADGRPVHFHSDPERTPDGQEVRRITPAGTQSTGGTLVKLSRSTAAKLAGACPVCAQNTQSFAAVLPPARSPQPVLRRRATAGVAGTGTERPRRAPSRLMVKARY